jgi:hypothetical protein
VPEPNQRRRSGNCSHGSINSSQKVSIWKIDIIGEEKSIINKGNAYAIEVNYNLLTAWMMMEATRLCNGPSMNGYKSILPTAADFEIIYQ